MKRLKKILKWSGILIGALAAVGLIVNSWYVWSTDARLAEQLEAIRASGEPLCLADLAREPIPPEQNAATYLREVEADLLAMHDKIYSTEWYNKWDGDQQLPAEGARLGREAFDAHPNFMPLIEKAISCPNFQCEIDYTFPLGDICDRHPLRTIRFSARILHHRALQLAADGNRDEAVRIAIIIFHLADLFKHNPLFSAHLVAITIRGQAVSAANFALQAGPVSEDVRSALETELAKVEREKVFPKLFCNERALLADSFRAIPGRNFWLYKRGYWNEQESGCLEMLERMPALADPAIPFRDAENRLLNVPARIRDSLLPMYNEKPMPIGSLYRAYLLAGSVIRARLRSLRVLNALQARAMNNGETPKLSELGLPIEATIDPFTGGSLHIKKLPEGWVVYSDGRNFKDDGGTPLGNFTFGDIGVGPPAATSPKK